MKKRVVLKKGRRVVTRRGNVVLHLAEKIALGLKPFSRRLQVAGSIRRREKNPVDIDIVLIPKNKTKIVEYMGGLGRYLQGGEKRAAFNVKGVKVEIYFATAETWGSHLLAYTGPSGAGIGLRTLARKKGYLLNQYGLFDRDSKRKIAGKTETSIYESLGKEYKAPWKR